MRRFRTKEVSIPQRDILIDHLDTECPINLRNGARHQGIVRLVSHGLLQYNSHRHPFTSTTTTVLTELGREMLCALLADYADTLARVALRQEDREFAVTQEMEVASLLGTPPEPLRASVVSFSEPG